MDCSVIVDCDSKTTILRVPHEVAVKMVYSFGNKELIDKLNIGASRSSILRDLIKKEEFSCTQRKN